MRQVLFVAPFAIDTTIRFVDAAAENPRSRTILISQDPIEKWPASVRKNLAGHWRVDNALDTQQLIAAGAEIQRRVGRVDCLLGTLEQLQVQLAEVREALNIPGMGARAANNFRDKSTMKDVMRAAGVPCARHRLIGREADALEFVDAVGFPIVIKPPAGAGAKSTYQVENLEALRQTLAEIQPTPARPTLAEEFIRGTEHSFDAVTIGGKMVWHSLTHYLPTPLDVLRNPWIQWCIHLPREIDHPRFDDIRVAAAAALRALGLDTGVCHLEWFRRGDGSVAISEVGARPGGAQISKLMSYAHDFSFYRAWARLMIEGTFIKPEREYSSGAAYLRGQGEGRVKKIHGLAQAQQDLGHLIVESQLPRIGQRPSSSYEGDGYVILRHRETQVVERALMRLISTVRVELG
jgi:D-alanine-D-alanine ligase-like ATP-grasp enzyme